MIQPSEAVLELDQKMSKNLKLKRIKKAIKATFPDIRPYFTDIRSLFLKMYQTRIMTLTFNVAGVPASDIDMNLLLNLQSNPDIIAIGFQEAKVSSTEVEVSSTEVEVSSTEVEISSTEAKVSSTGINEYIDKVTKFLSTFGFKFVDSVQLVGILLILLSRTADRDGEDFDACPMVSLVEKKSIKTGFNGKYRSKGAVGMSFIIKNPCGSTRDGITRDGSIRDEVTLTLINCHLPPNEEKLGDRIQAYNQISEEMTFDRNGRIENHDYAIWFGDLNFRIHELSWKEIVDSISKNDMRSVLERDELLMLMKDGKAFHGLKEAPITFAPTYKFDGNRYNQNRKPAWTDRVLYRMKPDQFGLDVNQVSYNVNFDLKCSDHRPVTSVMLISNY